MAEQRITFSRHAEEMLIERNIDREWVERAIRQPDIIESDPTRHDVHRAFRAIAEHNGRVLRVVYSSSEDKIRVITAFFDRARRR
jgi:Domain of unknown function (DUF4258)